MRRRGWAAAVLLAALSGCASNIALNQNYSFQSLKKIAVLGFSSLEESPGLGTTTTNVFSFALLKYGFNVVERNRVQDVLKEQTLASSGALIARDLKEVGNLLGADAIVVGSIERFKPEGETKAYYPNAESSPNVAGRWQWGGYDFSAVRTRTLPAPSEKYEVASLTISFRIVDVRTGEILVAGAHTAKAKTGVDAAKRLAMDLAKNISSQIKSSIEKHSNKNAKTSN